MVNEMNFLKNINKTNSAASLVENALVNGNTKTKKEIIDCIFLLANSMGDTWKNMSKEAAAGMALVVLAKNAMLRSYLNPTGWNLVLNFIESNPKLVRDISPGTLAEINSYQVFGVAGSG